MIINIYARVRPAGFLLRSTAENCLKKSMRENIIFVSILIKRKNEHKWLSIVVIIGTLSHNILLS